MSRNPPKLSAEAKAHKSEVTSRWHKENTVIIPVRVRRQKRDEYKAFAARQSESLSGLIVRLLDAEIENGQKNFPVNPEFPRRMSDE